MPGLKLLTDLLPNKLESRGTAFYTSSWSIGTGCSFYISGKINELFMWNTAFEVTSIGPFLAIILSIFLIPNKKVKYLKFETIHIKKVLSNKKAVGYSLSYFIHNIELFTFRGWILIFLFYNLSLNKIDSFIEKINPTTIISIITFLAMPSSVLFNELVKFYKRENILSIIMFFAFILPICLGIFSSSSYIIILILIIIYGIIIPADSSLITAGLIESAEKIYKGTTIGMHSFIGFTGSAIGPIIFGLLLDLGGGQYNYFSWLISFSAVGLIMLIAQLVIKKLIRNN